MHAATALVGCGYSLEFINRSMIPPKISQNINPEASKHHRLQLRRSLVLRIELQHATYIAARFRGSAHHDVELRRLQQVFQLFALAQHAAFGPMQRLFDLFLTAQNLRDVVTDFQIVRIQIVQKFFRDECLLPTDISFAEYILSSEIALFNAVAVNNGDAADPCGSERG